MNSKNYEHIFKFINTFKPIGFDGIDRNDSFIVDLEKLMDNIHQCFFVADLLQLKIIFTSEGCRKLTGISKGPINPYHFMDTTHPEDLHRRTLGLSKLIKMANDLFVAKQGKAILSLNLRTGIAANTYSDFLVQCYMFYTEIPYPTVFVIIIRTKIDQFKNKKYKFHYYAGEDLSYFRFPDKNLLETGNVFSEREFEIIQLIKSGMDSQTVAQKLFISKNTVNTHRRNILKKTEKKNLSELISYLKDTGVL